jgi:hypothetical protein
MAEQHQIQAKRGENGCNELTDRTSQKRNAEYKNKMLELESIINE